MHVLVGSHTIRVEVSEPALARALADVAAALGLETAGDGPSAATLRLATGPVPPQPAAGAALPYGEHLRVWREGGRSRAWSEHTALVAEADTAEGVVDAEHASPEEVVALFVLGVFLLLRPRGLFPLHAAVLARDGRGVVFAAPSDAGKSTLAYSLVRQGWAFLSDDSVLLHPAGDAVEAHAFRRSFGLDPDAEARFPEIAQHAAPQLTDAEKRSVPVEALYPAQAATCCTPRLLVFPEIADQPTSALVPVAKTEAFLRLVAQSALVHLDPRWAAEHLDVLRRLVAQAPAYRLHAGRDLLAEPATIVRLLEQTEPFEPLHA